MVPKAQGDIGVLGRITCGLDQGHFGKSDLAFAGASERFVGDRFVAAREVGQFVHTMAPPPCVEREAHSHGIVERCDGDAMLAEHRHIIF